MKLKLYLPVLVILTLLTSACQFANKVQNTIVDQNPLTGQKSTPISKPFITEGPTLEPAVATGIAIGVATGVASTTGVIVTTVDANPTVDANTTVVASTLEPMQTPAGQARVKPIKGKKPPQTHAAKIVQLDRRPELTRLSDLIGFQVLDQNGDVLGKVSDYIVNTCETYIIYFVMEPAAGLKFAAGNRLVIPFEVVTINSGALDAQAKTIQLSLTQDQLTSAPANPDSLQLFPNNWEAGARAYWQQVAWVSHLTSECNVSGGAVSTHKIAYATQLIGAELKDGNHNLLGTVADAILEPESGKLGFFVINLKDNQGLVLVCLAAVNIPKEALEPGKKIELVLLTDNQQLQNAPRLNTIEDATNVQAQSDARQYWGH